LFEEINLETVFMFYLLADTEERKARDGWSELRSEKTEIVMKGIGQLKLAYV